MNILIVKHATSQIGVKEIPGDRHNMTVVNYAKEIGIKWINDDETPWCATYVNWVLMKAGYKYSANATARSFDNYGTKTDNPEPGDIVVFWRESLTSGKGHVGFFMGYTSDDKIYVLGGNQSNMVTISKYTKNNLIGFRRVSESSENMEIPKPILKRGSKGKEVEKLQNILKYLGFGISKVDGDFGPNTENAVIAFQKKYKTPTSGIYDDKMNNLFFTILNE